MTFETGSRLCATGPNDGGRGFRTERTRGVHQPGPHPRHAPGRSFEHMLRGAAQQFASSLTAWDLSTCDFVQLVARNTTIRARCTALFLQHGDDPRCQVDFLLRTGDDDAGETS